MSFRGELLEKFPVPRFLSLRGGGLEISEHSIKHLELQALYEKGERSFRVSSYGSETLPDGTMVGGEIRDLHAVESVLSRLRASVTSPYVHLSLPEQKGYIFQVSFPKAPDLVLKDAIAFSLEERIALSPEDAVFDWEILSDKGTSDVLVNVTAFPRKTVEDLYAALRETGFVPLSFEMESQAAARALIPEGNEKVCMVVDFGDTRTSISIVDRGAVRFTTSIEVAGVSLHAALQKMFNITKEEAERLKNDEGIVAMSRGSKVAEALISTVSALRDEVNRRFVYWHTHAVETDRTGRPIEEIYLVGGNANLRGLPEYLGQIMRVPVRLPNVWRNVCRFETYIPPISRQESFRYATVAGLALRGFSDSL